jgi:mRNA-degrading endonuclease toxin of MazEF toxin-antitoxin module
VNRGEIYRVRRLPGNDPKRPRCFVIVSRQALIESKAARVVCAPINTTYVGLTTQVPVGIDEVLQHPSCINCDQLFTLDKIGADRLRRGAIGGQAAPASDRPAHRPGRGVDPQEH